MDQDDLDNIELGGLPLAAWASPENPFDLSNAEIVAQSIALAVQDAVSHLRSIEALSVAVTGVALNGLISSGDPRYNKALGAISAVVGQAASNYQHIAKASERLLQLDHPSDQFDEEVVETVTDKVFDEDGREIDKRVTRTVTRTRVIRDDD